MTKNNERHKAGANVFRFPEYPWQVLTVFSALIALVFFCAAIWWCFFDASEPGVAEARARIATPFLAFIGAVVTFCTVLWRGMINSRQANEDRRRNEHQEDVNQALLFEKAVGMLEDVGRPKYSYALAMLETVAKGQNDQLARHALVILLDQFVLLHRTYAMGIEFAPRYLETIANIFDEAGERSKGVPDMQIRMPEKSGEQNREIPFHVSKHMPISHIYNADFIYLANAFDVLQSDSIYFQSCSITPDFIAFQPQPFTVSRRFRDCSFSCMEIKAVKAGIRGAIHSFEHCDFSGCVFQNEVCLTGCTFKNCSYQVGNPPRLLNGENSIESLCEELGIVPKGVR